MALALRSLGRALRSVKSSSLQADGRWAAATLLCGDSGPVLHRWYADSAAPVGGGEGSTVAPIVKDDANILNDAFYLMKRQAVLPFRFRDGDPDAAQRDQRRLAEKEKQESIARARVQTLDSKGRAYATGKRKEAIARVWLLPGDGHMTVNSKPFEVYFASLPLRAEVLSPFNVTGTLGNFSAEATVTGGGPSGQAQALRHGISKALQAYDPLLRPQLRAVGLLTRDSRVVERKKPGKKKARKSFQWVKR